MTDMKMQNVGENKNRNYGSQYDCEIRQYKINILFKCSIKDNNIIKTIPIHIKCLKQNV